MRTLLVLLLSLLLNPTSSYAAIAHVVTTTAKASVSTTVTTSAVDTTGANFIAVISSTYHTGSVAVTDSKGNTYTSLTMRSQVSGPTVQIHYCASATVGSGHTFTLTGVGIYPTIEVSAFSGVHAAPFDQESGSASAASSTTYQPGSITPSQDGCLLVTGICTNSTTHTINSSFTATSADLSSGIHQGGGIAHKIQTTAGAENPTWTWATSSDKAAAMASFKAAASSSAVAKILLQLSDARLRRQSKHFATYGVYSLSP